MGDKIESWFTLPGRLALVILSEFRDKLDQDHKDVFVKAMSIGCYVSTLFIFLLKSSKTMEFLATYTYLSVFNTVTKAPIVHTKNWVTATGDLIVLLIMSVIIFISACMIMAMFVSYIAKLLIGGLTKVFKKDSERYTALIFLLIMLYIAIPVLMNIHWGSVGKITHNSSTPSSSINSGYILAICGLVLDVGGGILLARSVLRQKPSELSTQSGAYLGSNPHTVKNGIGASIEAKFAISLLVSGFFGQFTGTLVQGATNLQVSHKWTWIIGTILTSVIIAIVVWLLTLRSISLWHEDWNLIYTRSTEREFVEKLINRSKVKKREDQSYEDYIKECRDSIIKRRKLNTQES